MTAWMVKRPPRWLVYDLRIDDTSLIGSYRAQCAAIVRQSSHATLLERLRAKRDGLDGEASPSAITLFGSALVDTAPAHEVPARPSQSWTMTP